MHPRRRVAALLPLLLAAACGHGPAYGSDNAVVAVVDPALRERLEREMEQTGAAKSEEAELLRRQLGELQGELTMLKKKGTASKSMEGEALRQQVKSLSELLMKMNATAEEVASRAAKEKAELEKKLEAALAGGIGGSPAKLEAAQQPVVLEELLQADDGLSQLAYHWASMLDQATGQPDPRLVGLARQAWDAARASGYAGPQ